MVALLTACPGADRRRRAGPALRPRGGAGAARAAGLRRRGARRAGRSRAPDAGGELRRRDDAAGARHEAPAALAAALRRALPCSGCCSTRRWTRARCCSALLLAVLVPAAHGAGCGRRRCGCGGPRVDAAAGGSPWPLDMVRSNLAVARAILTRRPEAIALRLHPRPAGGARPQRAGRAGDDRLPRRRAPPGPSCRPGPQHAAHPRARDLDDEAQLVAHHQAPLRAAPAGDLRMSPLLSGRCASRSAAWCSPCPAPCVRLLARTRARRTACSRFDCLYRQRACWLMLTLGLDLPQHHLLRGGAAHRRSSASWAPRRWPSSCCAAR